MESFPHEALGHDPRSVLVNDWLELLGLRVTLFTDALTDPFSHSSFNARSQAFDRVKPSWLSELLREFPCPNTCPAGDRIDLAVDIDRHEVPTLTAGDEIPVVLERTLKAGPV